MNHNFNVIRRHRNPLIWLNLIVLSGTLLSATVLADIWYPPVWKVRAKLNVPSAGGNLNADLGTLGSLNDGGVGFSKEVSPLQIQSTIITSDAVMEKTLSIDPEKEAFPSVKSFKGLFTVEPQPQSTVILLEVRGSSTEVALARARNLGKAYQQRLNELRSLDVNDRQEFSQGELKQAQDKLIEAEQELSEFRLSRGIVDIAGQTQQLVSSINQLRTQLTLLQSEAEASQTRAEIAASYFKITPEQAIQALNLSGNREYQEVRQQLAQTEIELSEARSQYKDSSPQVQNLLFKRKQLTQKLAERFSMAIPNISSQEIDPSLGGNSSSKRLDIISELIASQTASQGLQQQTIQIQNQIAKLTSELDTISANKTKLVELERKHDIAEGVYKGIVAQINRSKIDNFNSYPSVQLIDGPNIDPKPDKASKKLILLGGMMASIFGSVGLLLFLESSSPLLSPRDLMLVELPILFSVARLDEPYLSYNSNSDRQLQQNSEGSSSKNILEPGDGELASSYLPLYKGKSSKRDDEAIYGYGRQYDNSAEREFERLATIVRSLVLENRRIMITSAMAGEGKTTITLGLAISLMELGFRVLLVDGDIQRASLSKHLNIVPEKQEADGVENQPIVNLSHGLDFIPAPVVPRKKTAQFFAGGNFQQYLDQVQTEGNYDYVLVDSSPVYLTSESMLMTPIVENVLFVVRPGESDRHSVLNSLEQLKLHKAQIQGLILNGVDSPSSSYRYSYRPQSSQALVAQQEVASYDSNLN